MSIPTHSLRRFLSAEGAARASVPGLVRHRAGLPGIALTLVVLIGLLACVLALAREGEWVSRAWSMVMPSLRGSWPFRWPMTVPFDTAAMLPLFVMV